MTIDVNSMSAWNFMRWMDRIAPMLAEQLSWRDRSLSADQATIKPAHNGTYTLTVRHSDPDKWVSRHDRTFNVPNEIVEAINLAKPDFDPFWNWYTALIREKEVSSKVYKVELAIRQLDAIFTKDELEELFSFYDKRKTTFTKLVASKLEAKVNANKPIYFGE